MNKGSPPWHTNFLLLVSLMIAILPGCLGYCFIAMKKHHDQDEFIKESISEAACLQFGRLIHDHHGGDQGRLGRQAWPWRHEWLQQRESLHLLWAFGARHTPSPTRPHLLLLPKQFHYPGANIQTYKPMGPYYTGVKWKCKASLICWTL